MLKISSLFFSYRDKTILSGIDMAVERGEILTIAGPNGTGKSTLLKCIARINKPYKGSISIDSRDISGMSSMDLARHLGYVPQSSPTRFPMTVFDAVLMGRRPHMAWRPSEHDINIVAETLKSMGLETLALMEFDRLSGGQKQKVLISRALVQEADYLLLDEPTSSLDLKHQIEVMEMIAHLVKTEQKGAVMAMHDLNLAARFSHKMIMLNNGRVFCDGVPREVVTMDNIRAVYGVEALVMENLGSPHVLPTASIRN
jgi:iron complex transport system ATP-binding protein